VYAPRIESGGHIQVPHIQNHRLWRCDMLRKGGRREEGEPGCGAGGVETSKQWRV